MSTDDETKWSSVKPTSIGLWQFKCMETDDKPEHAAITARGVRLTVHDSGLGETPLDRFHDGLTNIQWRKVS